jgi:hypothetical protein
MEAGRTAMAATLERTNFETKVRRAEEVLREAGAREVYVFGGELERGSRNIKDVRYAVRGLPPEVYYDTLARIWDAIDVFPVVQNLESADPFTRFLEQNHKLGSVDELFR